MAEIGINGVVEQIVGRDAVDHRLEISERDLNHCIAHVKVKVDTYHSDDDLQYDKPSLELLLGNLYLIKEDYQAAIATLQKIAGNKKKIDNTTAKAMMMLALAHQENADVDFETEKPFKPAVNYLTVSHLYDQLHTNDEKSVAKNANLMLYLQFLISVGKSALAQNNYDKADTIFAHVPETIRTAQTIDNPQDPLLLYLQNQVRMGRQQSAHEKYDPKAFTQIKVLQDLNKYTFGFNYEMITIQPSRTV